MMKCPSCSRKLPEQSRFCLSCGVALGDYSTSVIPLVDPPTLSLSQPDNLAPEGSRHTARFLSSDWMDAARFIPGTTLAGRYRIVGLLGRGGMGEVYRADDLKLGQPVALKFLPATLARDGAALARLHKEVRIARAVTHPNVCRVFDIGEVEDHHFLSMEYVDGEDLASLLRRIGRLPPDKALEIARQLCAGLAAAHDTGVLHRDLKPANVMIDARGKARITDFGLADLSGEIRGEAQGGTPAYMSPEQLARKEVTVRSDIYSLGLVLYETFTGKRAFESTTIDELIRLHAGTVPTSPSSLVKEIDPGVERVILRCLDKDPSNRPASALQIAALLPGGDPLAAALAAGETPSPEMVAAAPKEGSLRPAVAGLFLVSVFIGLALTTVLSSLTLLHRMVPLEKTPDVLKERASQVAQKLGYTGTPADVAFGFFYDLEHLRYVRDNDSSPNRWNRLATGQPAAVYFWYRQSPQYLVPYGNSLVSQVDPPNIFPGMVGISLDTTGRLVLFDAVPDQAVERSKKDDAPQDWSVLFKEAGLELENFQPAEPTRTPPHAHDARMTWRGTYPNMPDLPVRIEAAAYHGKPSYFEIINPWGSHAPQAPVPPTETQTIGFVVLIAVFFGIMLIGTLLAFKNIRLGRGDLKGAFRVTVFLFILRMVSWAASVHHVPRIGEVDLLIAGLQSALFWSCFVGLMYLALEPFLRSRWPDRIISWSRLLAGDFRDPLVGRDILIGALFGVGLILDLQLSHVVPRWLGWPPGIPILLRIPEMGMLGIRSFVPLFAIQMSAPLVQSFMVVFLLLFLAMLLRKNWLGIGAGWLVLSGFIVSGAADEGLLVAAVAFGFVTSTLLVFVAVRFGLLALMSALVFWVLPHFFPITTELTVWYAGDFILDLIFLVGIAVYGFYIALAGQPLFRGRWLEE
jgi:serine/threonine protein kinase